MRRMFGGKWVSFMGIPPFTFIFLIIMVPATMIQHAIDKAHRRKKLKGQKVNEAFIGSWF